MLKYYLEFFLAIRQISQVIIYLVFFDFFQARKFQIELPNVSEKLGSWLFKKQINFNSLPSPLRFMILESLDNEDFLKFLRVNRELQNHILYSGPFSKKIVYISFFLSDVQKQEKI